MQAKMCFEVPEGGSFNDSRSKKTGRCMKEG